MRTVFISSDQQVFTSEKKCREHERRTQQKIRVPLFLIKEAIRQATPYMVTAKERRDLAAKLEACLPKG